MDKETQLNRALNIIVDARFEGQCINKDFLGYWDLFYRNVLNISTTGLKGGIVDFNLALKENAKCAELYGYHVRLYTTLINSPTVIGAAEELYVTLRHALEYEVDSTGYFDLALTEMEEIKTISGFDKIMIFMHIYQDTIDCKLRAKITSDRP